MSAYLAAASESASAAHVEGGQVERASQRRAAWADDDHRLRERAPRRSLGSCNSRIAELPMKRHLGQIDAWYNASGQLITKQHTN